MPIYSFFRRISFSIINSRLQTGILWILQTRKVKKEKYFSEGELFFHFSPLYYHSYRLWRDLTATSGNDKISQCFQ